ncbi:hypothetical protein [Mycolicibacterium austroafricanum]|uniref:hypothetical protein n=1 Tax=Mycolicibacterium austroafricanum TaxID=39687 RepID=UPI001ABF28AC|nr:hypothetical protein [Mycolicibacterium austroafricanum]QRZ05936.1 hypothetical protein JN090_23915 [Mycolicibacterium austroafricanum]
MAASGRSGDTTFGKNGVNAFRLSKLRSQAHVDPALQNRRYPDTPEVMRACIEQGICPFCGEQYKLIAKHTRNTHGIDKDELKAMAGIPKSRSACSSEFRQKLSDSAKAREDLQSQVEKLRKADRPKKRKYSEAGAAVQRAKLEAGRDPARVGETISRRRRAETAERDAQIVARVRGGEFLADVAKDFGLHVRTASTICRRAGLMDLRKQAASIRASAGFKPGKGYVAGR